ncbi:putative membrane protein [Bradyrhizobium elkanii]
MQRMDVGGEQLLLALILLADQLLDQLGIEVEQRAERAEIDDVLEQLALPGIGVGRVGDRGQRHADDGDVLAEFRRRHRLGRIVEQIAAGLDRGDVLVPGLRVHRHHQVDAAAGAEMAVLGDAHLIPGRQALDVGREDVAWRDRHAVAQDRAREQFVGGSRARTVDVGEADDEVVYAADRALD